MSAVHHALQHTDAQTRLVILLAVTVGLRRSEIARVRRDDLNKDTNGWCLSIEGKGGIKRIVPITTEIAALLNYHLNQHESPWLFPSHTSTTGHAQPRWIYQLARQALPPGWSLHTLRHRFATNAYSAQRDLIAVQRLLGHVSVATTMRYTSPPDDAMRQAIQTATNLTHQAPATCP